MTYGAPTRRLAVSRRERRSRRETASGIPAYFTHDASSHKRPARHGGYEGVAGAFTFSISALFNTFPVGDLGRSSTTKISFGTFHWANP